MILTFYDAQKRLLIKNDYPAPELMTETEEIQTLDNVKWAINAAIEHIYELKMPWLRPKPAYLEMKDTYSTGTITATQGSKTITGSGTAWTRDMIGQLIRVTDTTDGAQSYEIEDVTSATSITLSASYVHTGGAGMSYQIVYNVFLLPPDFKTSDVLYLVETSGTYQQDDTLLQTRVITSGSPIDVVFTGLSDNSYYDVGTVSVAAGGTAVVGVTGVWDSTMVGRYIQLGTYSRLYKISAVADANNLTIDKGFGGSALSGAKYKIDPPNRMRIRMHGAADTAQLIPYSYWPFAPLLTDDEDIVPVPSRNAVIRTAEWLWFHEEDRPEVESAKQKADEAIALLANRGVDTKQKRMYPRRW